MVGFFPPHRCCLFHREILHAAFTTLYGLFNEDKPAIKSLVRKTCSHFCCCCCGPLPAEDFFLKGEGRKRGIEQSVKWDLNPCNCGYMSRQLIGWRHRDRVQSCEHTAFCSVQIQFDCELFIFFIFLRPSTNGSPLNSHLGFSSLLIQAPSLRVANVTVQLWNMAVPMACVAVSHAGTWPIVALQCWQLQIKRKKRKGNVFPLLPAEKKNHLYVLHALIFLMQFMQELVLNIHIFIL